MKTYAVIGKNFGDEGKGLVSASLCLHFRNKLVIKHNGGGQAGHTVEGFLAGREFRFIHHQIGSGAEFGADTLFAETFNPDLYQLGKELEQFIVLFGFMPRIYSEKNTPITIIDDVLLNMALEEGRGNSRHGSCGMGINECRKRLNAGFGLTVGEVEKNSVEWIYEKLKLIREQYIIPRAIYLGLIGNAQKPDMREDFIKIWTADEENESLMSDDGTRAIGQAVNEAAEGLLDDDILVNFAEEIKRNVRNITIVDADRQWLERFEAIVFETGQGLLLDEFYLKYAPYLTTSRTGAHNPVTFLARRKMKLDEVIYVTRSYVTRHGNGPLPCECRRDELQGVEHDKTNEKNEWQGAIRYAYHPGHNEFFEAIADDAKWLDMEACAENTRVSLAVTHLNETGGKLLFCGSKLSIAEFKNMYIGENILKTERKLYEIYELTEKYANDFQR